MEIDKITLQDLAIFGNANETGVFDHFNLTRTVAGKHQLMKNLSAPLSNLDSIRNISNSIRSISTKQWPVTISNGTIMVVEQFTEARIDQIPKNPSTINALGYKVLNNSDYVLCKYAVEHYSTMLQGMQEIVRLFSDENNPKPLADLLNNISTLIQKEEFNILYENKNTSTLQPASMLKVAHFLRYKYKRHVSELVMAYAQLDAWYAVGQATKKYQLTEVQWQTGDDPVLEAISLRHLLLNKPVPYNIHLQKNANFMFLTSANMAGKSTFIKAVGIAVYLAHCGFPVPAESLKLSVMDGLLSNINIVDNLSKGESYFYNEVKRISKTVSKISNGKKWLVLIDELFKGTNVQDAMKCSTVVIEGLLKINTSLFILSTHLYEIADQLAHHTNIRFMHFETTIEHDQPVFHYTLKEGVSHDRLGYLILKQSGVVKMLNDL